MKTVLFVCVHNAGRSQMAEAYINHRARRENLPIRAESAGTLGGATLHPLVMQGMEEIGVSMAGQRPKLLTQAVADAAACIITMGCGVEAEACPARLRVTEDWGLDDPKEQPIEKVREIRDQVVAKCDALLAAMDIPPGTFRGRELFNG